MRPSGDLVCPAWCRQHVTVDGISYHEGAERLVVVEEIRGPDTRFTVTASRAMPDGTSVIELRTNAVEADPGAPPLVVLEEDEARALAAALLAVADDLASEPTRR